LICLAAGLKGWLIRRQGRPACPTCGSPMVLRRARRGQNAGNDFWGCSNYPSCRGIRNVGE
jgi:restriction system protein